LKSSRRVRRTERRSDDRERVTFDRERDVSIEKDAFWKQEGALSKRNASPTIEDVAFSIERAPASIQSVTFSRAERRFRNQVARSQFIGREYR
jgi:hypothetical protein